ncbi:MAG TPA: heavy metal-binding domain-containing protein [Fimbriimonadaceae bacterium]|jgi:uncharacterized protein YbjQ (UPF0145 family)
MIPPEMTPEERQAASQANIAAGGLPLNAIDRLRDEASKVGTAKHIFTSDLSPNELLLTRKCGFEPLGQVMGSCIYHVGWYAGPGWNWMSGELTVITQAYYAARHLAMNRLQQEAKILGASGVVGVQLTMAEYSWGQGLIEFAAVGTALREIGAPPLAENVMPFVSSLNGQDHFTLRQAGYRPVGFAMGNCTWFQYASWRTQQATGGALFGGGWNNQELTDYTQGAYNAREFGMQRMQAEARAVNAAGVVGVTVDLKTEQYETQNQRGLILHFTALGTCIAPDFAAPKTVSVRPDVILLDVQ